MKKLLSLFAAIALVFVVAAPAQAVVGNRNTGAHSFNYVKIENKSIVKVTTVQVGVVANFVVSNVSTGGNKANENTKGDVYKLWIQCPQFFNGKEWRVGPYYIEIYLVLSFCFIFAHKPHILWRVLLRENHFTAINKRHYSTTGIKCQHFFHCTLKKSSFIVLASSTILSVRINRESRPYIIWKFFFVL